MILFVSHNKAMFVDGLKHYALSEFFSAILNIRVAIDSSQQKLRELKEIDEAHREVARTERMI